MIYDFLKEKKFGYTTGSCVVAGAYCGIYYLKHNIKLNIVELENSKNDKLIIPIEDVKLGKIATIKNINNTGKIKPNRATTIVKKFSGEDIDITNGIDIVVDVELLKMEKDKPKIEIVGGNGVGIVTKDGLQIKKGEYAINPKPREMIKNNIINLLDDDERAIIKITIPKGEELAKKTLNPKLGIIGGISILGTTGIVRPMSNEAYKESLAPQIDVALANNYKKLIFTPGNIGTKYAKIKYGVDDDNIVEVSNFWSFMLDKAVEKGVKDILIFGHSGKIIKLAGGIYDTHSKVADARNEILTAYSSPFINDKQILKNILYSNTTEEIIKILEKENILHEVFNLIAERVVERVSSRWEGIKFSCVIIDMKGDILGSHIYS
ncbi:cobalt-precorrin-5B (C(1))-methyltransferase CbiD [Methanococcus aeolicus]|uniref:cobalt-precorrin-5B (C(1))-methyltransferase CbiD n=1 Tax=Methanococcus aeolicus TaxID=42879 RepID=UPI0021C60C02|nr:cobalt-precorrin-5B (C(1))-methyltransferase CbiD [Methanococcus aeolicus]UXM85133.1 cobalt-precorrin-5B (C(1))-methyltransferase CbiD [Methanococcus aeolicus]